MEKVIVNKKVADLIEEVKREFVDPVKEKETFSNMWAFIDHSYREVLELEIDLVTLAKAIQYGYEVPYEFKVGDILKRASEYLEVSHTEVMHINKFKDDFTLVCKAENREDMKVGV